MDLLDWFRGVYSWAKLYRLLGALPPESRYKTAIVMDREAAERVARLEAAGVLPAPADDDGAPPSPYRYDPTVARLDTLIDLLQYLLNATNVGLGGSSQQPKPMPRPVTELARARERIELEQLEQAADAFFGSIQIIE